MSDDINENITITGESSGAITALDGAISSVGQFDGSLKKLGDTFTQPLEHVGVQLFGRELLSSMGIAGAARPVIQLLNVAVNETATMFGIASGPIGLAVMGLTAVAAIAYKVIESQEAHTKSIQSQVDEAKKQYAGTLDAITSLENYKKAVGELPPVLKALEDAEKSKMGVTRQTTIETETEQIASLKKTQMANLELIATNNTAIAQIKEHSAGYMKFAAEVTGANAQLEKMSAANSSAQKENITLGTTIKSVTADVTAQKNAFKDWEDEVKQGTKGAEDANAKIGILDQSLNALYSKDKQLMAEDERYTGNAWESKTATAKRSLEKTLGEITKYEKDYETSEGKNAKDITTVKAAADKASADAYKLYNDQKIAAIRSFFGVEKSLTNAMVDVASSGFKSIADAVGSSTAQMIVNHKSWAATFKSLFNDVLTTGIADIISLQVKHLAANTLMGSSTTALHTQETTSLETASAEQAAIVKATSLSMVTNYAAVAEAAAGAFGASLGPVGSAAAIAEETALMAPFISVIAAADGANMDVDKPTLFVAGERGREHVQVTPATNNPKAEASQSKGGGGNTYNFIANGNDDPVSFMKKCMDYILRETRGRGQITVKSASIH